MCSTLIELKVAINTIMIENTKCFTRSYLRPGLVEFLGPRLSSDELSQIWAMGDKSFHVVDNLHGVLAAAAPKLAAPQLDHLLSLVQEVLVYFTGCFSLHLS